MALLQLKLAMIKLLSNWEVTPCEKTAIPMVFNPKSFLISPLDSSIFLNVKKYHWWYFQMTECNICENSFSILIQNVDRQADRFISSSPGALEISVIQWFIILFLFRYNNVEIFNRDTFYDSDNFGFIVTNNQTNNIKRLLVYNIT